MSPKTKKFSDLAAPLYADPERRARIAAEKQSVLAAMRLVELRESRGLTQLQLAERLGVSQVNVSRIERAEDTQLSTISRYVQGLGGHLELRAIFDDEQTVALALPATRHGSPVAAERCGHPHRPTAPDDTGAAR